MSELLQNTNGGIGISSSLGRSRWQNGHGASAFERWHFDALSDDGREAVCITFYDNYVFSPRYYKNQNDRNEGNIGEPKRFPAVSVLYCVDGKIVLKAVNEFTQDGFSVSESSGFGCTVGRSSFRVEAASYGSGFIISLDLLTSAKRKIVAELEWLSIESDLSTNLNQDARHSPSWNLVAPRSDVSGRISLIGRSGKLRKVVHFRGTGYHDHFYSERPLSETMGSRFWGRAHFVDSTAVFHHHETDGTQCSKLFLIREGRMESHDVPGLHTFFSRDRFGIRQPERLYFLCDESTRLRVKPIRTIQSSIFAKTIESEVTLMLGDGKPRKTIAITELIRPAQMRSSVVRWLADRRIGKRGKGPLF